MKTSCVLSAMVLTVGLVSVGWAATYPIPAALYHFDSDVADAIDNSTATLYGGANFTTSASQVGAGCLDVSGGSTAHASVPDGALINGTNNWAISFWYKRTANDEWGSPLSFGGTLFHITYTGSNWPNNSYSILNSAYGLKYSAFTPAPLGDWQFFAVTADGSTFRAYQGYNGVLTQTVNTPNGANLLNGSSTLYLGYLRPWEDAWNYNDLDGCMDELGIWNQGLSQTQVQAVFDAGAAGTNLVPEPVTLALLTLGGLLGIHRRK